MKIFKPKQRTIRGSWVVVLPEELLLKLKATQGESLLAAETGRGLLLFCDAEVEEQVRLGLESMAKRRKIFWGLGESRIIVNTAKNGKT
jgi:hypothetical protein